MKDEDFSKMSDWKICENCKYYEHEQWYCLRFGCHSGTGSLCSYWDAIRCRCGGALSVTRYHNGRKYRHCYACHSEFFKDT